MDNKPFIAYITKYALTAGIVKKRVRLCTDVSDEMVEVVFPGDHFAPGEYYHRGDWYRTPKAAEARVTEMIEAKRRSIEKQLKKLDKLEASLETMIAALSVDK